MRTKMDWMRIALTLCLAVMMVAAVGCAKKKPPVEQTYDNSAAAGAGANDGASNDMPSVEDLLFSKAEGLQVVYFDYDSYALSGDALATLKANADKIKATQKAIIQVAGHCDERGTQEYNMALGERRALAVRDYLIKLGVPGNRLVTISYGEEMPADPGHSEASWAKNRRAEFNRGQ